MLPEELLIVASKDVLEACRVEYDHLATTFRALDTKAQGTATIAGGFLAAALAFVGRVGALNPWWSRMLAALAVVFLVIAIGYSVVALTIRAIVGPPSGVEMAKMLKDLLRFAVAGEALVRLPLFYRDAAAMWIEPISKRRSANLDKAAYVLSAQLSLIAAAVCVALLVVLRISTEVSP